jgi:hypothetical protein
MRDPFPNWQDLGIPKGYASPRLLYNQPSQTLILEVKPQWDGRAPSTLILLRSVQEDRYSELTGISPDLTCENVVTAERAPVAYFNGSNLKPHGETWAGDWAGLYHINLETRETKLVIAPGQLPVPESGTQRPWIAQLHTVSSDGKLITVTVGVPKGYEMHYKVSTIDLETMKIEHIVDLLCSFF